MSSQDKKQKNPWGDTIHMPIHQMDMRANLPKREPDINAFWQEPAYLETMQSIQKDREEFILHDGPPYANGDIHLGHAFNKILKDIVNKSKMIQGYKIDWTPGWDCHGLPIELRIEQEGYKRKEDAAAFIAACRAYAELQVSLQRTSFKMLGVAGNWDEPYITMAPQTQAATMRVLADIWEKGYIYRGDKPVHWCRHCTSSLAEAEVEYADRNSPSIDILFHVDSQTAFNRMGLDAASHKRFANLKIALLAWTTTPWTLPSNQMLAVAQDQEYGLYRLASDEHSAVILATELLEQVQVRSDNALVAEPLCTFEGREMVGLLAQHPFLEKEVQVAHSSHVTMAAGTGVVHIAPDHGMDDWLLGTKHGIKPLRLVNSAGVFVQNALTASVDIADLPVDQAEKAVVDLMRQKHTLFSYGRLDHSFPHCWRHKTPTFFRTTAQWFVSMQHNQLQQRCMEAADTVQFFPERGRERFKALLGTRPDWCISRQRTWGNPLAVLLHKTTGEAHPDTPRLLKEIASYIEDQGIEAWQNLAITALLPDEEASEYEKSTDVLDVWFDSGVSHSTVIRQRGKQLPADVYLEGSDQHRGWFQTAMLTSMAVNDAPPYKAVITHGFLVDSQGQKMAKSGKNAVSPQKEVSEKGADILRLWVASCDYSREVVMSQDVLKQSMDTFRKLRNTLRYITGNVANANEAVCDHLLPVEDCLDIDKYILNQCQAMQKQVQKAYNNYDFSAAIRTIYRFCNDDLSQLYFDISKDRLYTCPYASISRRAVQSTLYRLGKTLCSLLAPILSFTAEETWRALHHHKPISFQDSVFNTVVETRANTPCSAQWEDVLKIRDSINFEIEQQRNEGTIKGALEVVVQLRVNEELYAALQPMAGELHYIFLVSEVSLEVTTASSKYEVAISLSDKHRCARCWLRRLPPSSLSEGQDGTDDSAVCARCQLNLEGDRGETRYYA